MNRILLCSLVITLTSLSILRGEYQPLEDFNSLQVGQALDGEDGWSVKLAGDASALIVEDPEDRTERVLELKGPTNSEEVLIIAKDGLNIRKPPYPSVSTIFFKFRLGSGEGTESLKIGVSHLTPEEMLDQGPVSLKQYFWIRGGEEGWSPMLFNADGSAVIPTTSLKTDIWYCAWLVVSNGSETVSTTRLYISSPADPDFVEMKEVVGNFVEMPVPVPFISFGLIKQESRSVYLSQIAYNEDSETPGEEPNE